MTIFNKYRIVSKVRFTMFIIIMLSIIVGVVFVIGLSAITDVTLDEPTPQEISECEPVEIKQIQRLSEYDKYLLARIAMAEAEGEDVKGKALVMLVVLNRVASDEFPDTVEEVIFQNRDGIYQFEPVMNGRFYNVHPNEDCYKALEMILLYDYDESQGATYFISGNVENTWHNNSLRKLFVHDNHTFYV